MLANDGAIIYSLDVDSIFVFRRGALRKTEATPEDATRQSDVVVTVRSFSLPFFSLSCLMQSCATHLSLPSAFSDRERITENGKHVRTTSYRSSAPPVPIPLPLVLISVLENNSFCWGFFRWRVVLVFVFVILLEGREGGEPDLPSRA